MICRQDPRNIFADPLGRRLKVSSALTSLDLSENQIGVPGAKALAGVLKVSSALKDLNLSDNQLCGLGEDGKGTYTDGGIKALAEALKVSSALTHIDLSLNNQIGFTDAAALAGPLRPDLS